MSVTQIEIFFVFWTAIGLISSLLNFGAAALNSIRLRSRFQLDQAERAVLRADLRRAGLFVCALASLFGPAIVIVITPNSEGEEPSRSLPQLVIVWGLLLTPFFLALNSIMDGMSRRRLAEAVAADMPRLEKQETSE